MIAEFGLFFLILALCFAAALVVVPFATKTYHMRITSRYVYGQCFFIFLAYLCLTICFLRDDFTVIYVLTNSSLALPWFYKLCAVWGGHEGSMLLWLFVLSLWMLSVSLFSRQLEEGFRVRVLMILSLLIMGFILFLLLTSNPFLRQFDVLNSQGRDLNPLLQDIGFLFHPPMLYMGYVGFSVAFAFAVAALWMGRMDPIWAKWTRPWTLAAWCCLTTGITLGSWWAYRELGWGGWWFWDPVENASFMPWLVGTALIHSLMVSERRQQFVAWTVLLSMTAFSLSLIGTFLVRSGVLTSVHAFAVDPARGLYILIFLLFVIGGSLLLFALRANTIRALTHPSVISRESSLLLNNVFLTVTMLTVLLGTIYPLLIDGLGLGKLSVGAPYFNALFVPLMVPLFILMGIGIHLRWQRDKLKRFRQPLIMIALISLISPCFIFFRQPINFNVYCGVALASWIVLSTFFAWFARKKHSMSFYGMMLAHLGVAISILGVAISSGYGVQDDMRFEPGQIQSFAGFNVKFDREFDIRGPNYHGTRARFLIDDKVIYPEKRIYNIGKMPMTESAIDVTPFRDLYIALGEPLDEHAWSVRLYYKPFVRWIWAGGFMMLLGGVFAMLDRRYRVEKS